MRQCCWTSNVRIFLFLRSRLVFSQRVFSHCDPPDSSSFGKITRTSSPVSRHPLPLWLAKSNAIYSSPVCARYISLVPVFQYACCFLSRSTRLRVARPPNITRKSERAWCCGAVTGCVFFRTHPLSSRHLSGLPILARSSLDLCLV